MRAVQTIQDAGHVNIFAFDQQQQQQRQRKEKENYFFFLCIEDCQIAFVRKYLTWLSDGRCIRMMDFGCRNKGEHTHAWEVCPNSISIGSLQKSSSHITQLLIK